MLTTVFPGGLRGPVRLPDWLRSMGYAFIYWFVLLLAIEPGNAMHAESMGRALDFDREALRICVASLLGCSSAPAILALSRRFPVFGARGWRSFAIHAAGAIALAFVLIVISCVLEAWILMGQSAPSMRHIRGELAGNWLLLIFALSAFALIRHAMNVFPQRSAAIRDPSPSQPARVAIKTRGRLGYVDLASIEWIESQGNYLALHVDGRSHLIRETLQSFESRLDPGRFVRVHRRVIVAIDQVREIQPLTNGDSTLILRDGRTIRASRSYREAIHRHYLPKGLPRS